MDVDEIRAQDLKVLEEQLQSLHLEVCTLRDSNQESQNMLENEVLLKVGAQERLLELQAQFAQQKDLLSHEQLFKEQALSSLTSCELRLNTSIAEILEAQKTVDDLYHSLLTLRLSIGDSSPTTSDSPNLAVLSFPQAGTLKENIDFLRKYNDNTVACFRERELCVRSQLTAAEQNIQCLQCQREEILDGLSRWESTCIFLEEGYRQKIAWLEDRLVSSEARVGILESSARTLEQTQMILNQKNETLNQDLNDVKNKLEDAKKENTSLLSQVSHLVCFCGHLSSYWASAVLGV